MCCRVLSAVCRVAGYTQHGMLQTSMLGLLWFGLLGRGPWPWLCGHVATYRLLLVQQARVSSSS